jgi:hypothetical protein
VKHALIVTFAFITAAPAQQRLLFAPTATDPAITQFTNNRYAVVDPALPERGRLVVFLPGTGAVPFNYSDFVENAASLGFRGRHCLTTDLEAARGEITTTTVAGLKP